MVLEKNIVFPYNDIGNSIGLTNVNHLRSIVDSLIIRVIGLCNVFEDEHVGESGSDSVFRSLQLNKTPETILNELVDDINSVKTNTERVYLILSFILNLTSFLKNEFIFSKIKLPKNNVDSSFALKHNPVFSLVYEPIIDKDTFKNLLIKVIEEKLYVSIYDTLYTYTNILERELNKNLNRYITVLKREFPFLFINKSDPFEKCFLSTPLNKIDAELSNVDMLSKFGDRETLYRNLVVEDISIFVKFFNSNFAKENIGIIKFRPTIVSKLTNVKFMLNTYKLTNRELEEAFNTFLSLGLIHFLLKEILSKEDNKYTDLLSNVESLITLNVDLLVNYSLYRESTSKTRVKIF